MNRDTRRTRVLLALLLVTSVALVLIDHRAADESPLDGVRGAAAAVFGPVEQVAAAIAGPVSDAVDGVSSIGDDADEVDRLRRRNEELTRRLRTGELDRNRAAQLDALLHVAATGRYRVVPAQVIAIGAAQSFSWTVTIDAGTRDGVRADMTVLDGDGLVGRVKTAGPSTATVLLAVDPESSVGVRLEGSMEVGFTTGQGIDDDGALDLRLLDGQSTVAPGDRLVTFGSQGDTPYVPGVPVGVARRVQGSPGSQTRTAVVEPYVDFTALDLVGVVVEPPRTDPRDAVLPPRPTPSESTPRPTVTVTVQPGGRR
ncbi:MAG TPA: rod shape-determining protein MreC [Actinomycetes bacterium]|nr:rod shape-determining protein MreC [Actinomycetes bacterium]